MNRHRTLPLGLAIALLAAPAPAQTPPTPTPQALLDAAHEAAGGAALDRLTTTVDHGHVTVGGLSGQFQDFLDWVHVRQANVYTLGPTSGSQGWDGTGAWSTDSSGQVRVERSAEAVAAALGGAYLATSAMFWPDRAPARIETAPPRTEGGTTYPTVKITPKNADPMELWFDPATHLVARVVMPTGDQVHTVIYGDYRAQAGVQVPFHTIVRTGDDPKFDQVIVLEAFAAAPVPNSRFASPPPPAYDASFPAGRTAVTVPFRLLNNHIYLSVAIDQRPTIAMLFDTGAINFLDTTHARQLGLTATGGLPGGGFGNQISSIGLTRAKTVAVGGLVLHDQMFATDDLGSFRDVEGADPAGLIGYEFAKRAVMTIDYAQRTITFTRPDSFHPPAGVAAIPFTFAAHIPMVQARVDGVAGQFEIDTGARSALTLMHPFVQANGLVARYQATRMATTGYGIGGPSKALLARIGTLVIGQSAPNTVTLHGQVADLVQDARGAGASEHVAGNIGGDILRRFTLTLDYPHQLLYLQPNALAASPGVFDRSGLWVNRADDGMIAIEDVTAGSAAAKAGLVAGDRILAATGLDARTVELSDLREILKRDPGTVVRLLVKGKDGRPRHVALTLADQV